jgi:hypothetical protein
MWDSSSGFLDRTLYHRIISCDEVIQLAYGKLVILLRDLFMLEIMHARAPEVFLYQ